MKTFWMSLAVVSMSFGFEYGLVPNKVSDNIYCFWGKAEAMNATNNGNMVNGCYVDMGHSWLVIDSGPSYNWARETHVRINAIKKQPIAYVLNTHYHDDHWLGNAYYATLGATIVGSQSFTTEVDTSKTPRMQSRISPEAYKGTSMVLPQKLLSLEGITLDIEGKKVHIDHVPNRAHTIGDLVITVPHAKVIFGGDLIFNDRVPSAREGNLQNWIAALERIDASDARYVIAGHGSITDRTSTKLTLGYLRALQTAVRSAIDEDIGIDEAVKTIELEAYAKTPMYESLHRQNVETAYRTMEWE
ncbi:MAG: hypothetical protein KU37_06580 [Sulfuricurvum sp. PC08-66]|nr:MAG: hypothetical protein KU37_06580 [Sulfuricurvum sp. PC08-66]